MGDLSQGSPDTWRPVHLSGASSSKTSECPDPFDAATRQFSSKCGKSCNMSGAQCMRRPSTRNQLSSKQANIYTWGLQKDAPERPARSRPRLRHIPADARNALWSVPRNRRRIECSEFSDIATRILRCYQRSPKADRTGNFAHKIVAVAHDELIVRPSSAKAADLIYDPKIRSLAESNTKTRIRSS